MTCFAPETMILTAEGEQPVEWLETGVRVVTRDHGSQPLAAVLRVTRSPGWFAENPAHCPIVVAPGGLDHVLPVDRLALMGNHRLLLRDPLAEMYFGFNEVLVPLHAWQSSDYLQPVVPENPVTFTFLLFEQHEIVQAEGVWSESFFPDAYSMSALAFEDRPIVDKVMPNAGRLRTARRVLTLTEAQLVVQPVMVAQDTMLTA